MKHPTALAAILFIAVAAARAVPFSDLDTIPKRADLAQIEAERAEGADERTLAQNHPSLFSANREINGDTEASSDDHGVKATISRVVKRTEQSTSGFLNNLLRMGGLKGDQLADTQNQLEQQLQENVAKADEGSTQQQQPHIKRVELQPGQAQRQEKDQQAQQGQDQQESRSVQGKDAQIDSDRQMMDQQDAQQQGVEQKQDASQQQGQSDNRLVEELREWQHSPERKRAEQEFEKQNRELDRTLEERETQCG